MTQRPDHLDLLDAHDGLLLVGDVHGDFDAFADACALALERNLLVVSLGDLIDRGPDSVGCMRLMIALVREGKGTMVPGNHDAKLVRYLEGANVQISPHGLGLTIEQIRAHPQGRRIAEDFAEIVAQSPLWRAFGGLVAVHAAFDPRAAFLRAPILGEPWGRGLQALSLYGETGGATDDEGKPLRTYGWADHIAPGRTVAIGHDSVSVQDVVRRIGARGGTVLHLDTGCQTRPGGRLSTLAIPRDEIPADPDAPARPRLTLVLGPEGAGKTALARLRMPHAVLLSPNDARQTLFGDPHQGHGHAKVLKQLRRMTVDALSTGAEVAVELPGLDLEMRHEISTLVPETHGVAYLLVDRPFLEKTRTAPNTRAARHAVSEGHRLFHEALPRLLAGDGIAKEVIPAFTA
jgi:protein phosphatase